MVSADTTLVAVRESLEAFLIISIFAGLVVKLGHAPARKWLLWGALAAFAASVVAGAILIQTIGHEIPQEKIFEGVAALLAVGILTYMIVWMYRHTLDLIGQFREKAKAALEAGKPAVLFSIAFVAVGREGLETVLLFATRASSETALDLALAALIGIGASAIVAFLLFTGIVRLNLKGFFAVSGLLLIFFAAGLAMYGVHELTEEAKEDNPDSPFFQTAWDSRSLLDQSSTPGSIAKAVLGYRSQPTVIEAAVYFAYLGGMGAWYLQGTLRRRPAEPVPAAPTPQTSA